MALPLLGGAPAVWTVALVFFQTALLAGYAYAHSLARLRSLVAQVVVHGGVLASAMAALPIAVSRAAGPPREDLPIAWLFALFTLSVGAPFAALSATAPLLQNWYARTRQKDARDPYYLYVASNAGSLLSLFVYPLVVDYHLGLGVQSRLWTVAFVGVVVAVVTCGVVALRQDQGSPSVAAADVATTARERLRQRVVWVGASAIPVALLVGATAHITTDVAAAPFLWAPPLILYLLTFIIAFGKKPLVGAETAGRLFAVVGSGGAALVAATRLPPLLAIPIDLGAVFLGALVCHHALAARRPQPARLTEFYLFVSLGGVVGGLTSGLAAPLVFSSVREYPIALVLALLALAPWGELRSWTVRGPLLAVTALPLLVGVARHAWPAVIGTPILFGAFVVAVVAALSLRSQPLVFAGAATLMLLAALDVQVGAPDVRVRSFFGVLTVETQLAGMKRRTLAHGTTIHGAQSLVPGDEHRPISYYAIEGPMGSVIARRQAASAGGSYGVAGLGAGALACYAKAGESWRFFEIDPMVARIARDPRYFTFLSDCAPSAPIVLGDARLTLAATVNGPYDILVVDAFSSDTVPQHLLTREALRLYVSKLKPDGVVLFHISNRHMNLQPTLARVIHAEGLAMRFGVLDATAELEARGVNSTDVMMAGAAPAVSALAVGPMWREVATPSGAPWSDDHANPLEPIIDRYWPAK
ncbi:MAG: fused MFS/spermidine synthase [Polyangiaceae bacterium]|nr:fused MFS/spermidine synthase [Polyangiaceae bacterium]